MNPAEFSILSTTLLLIFILDPFGNIPLLLSLVKKYDNRTRYKIILREMVVALVILLAFLFGGRKFLSLFHLETVAVTIAGGVIFFIIGLKLIFPSGKDGALFPEDSDPFIVPMALPMVAGPSALATLMVLAKNNPGHTCGLTVSLILAWAVSALVFLTAPTLYRFLKDKGVTALERLMGMLLLIMSVQMFIDGLRELIPGLSI